MSLEQVVFCATPSGSLPPAGCRVCPAPAGTKSPAEEPANTLLHTEEGSLKADFPLLADKSTFAVATAEHHLMG